MIELDSKVYRMRTELNSHYATIMAHSVFMPPHHELVPQIGGGEKKVHDIPPYEDDRSNGSAYSYHIAIILLVMNGHRTAVPLPSASKFFSLNIAFYKRQNIRFNVFGTYLR